MIKKIITFLVLLMSLGTLAYADLTTDNQAYYAFDDSTSEYEIFGATGTSDGMSFDGVNDYVLSESYPLDTTMDLSVEFKSSFSGSSRTIMARSSDSSNRQFQLYQRSSDNKIQMSFFNGGSTNVGTLESDIAYNDGNWHTVRIVQSGNNAEMFIDGISVDTDSTSGKVTDTQKNTIGAYHDGSGSYWLGEIGEVNINDKTYLLSSLNDSSSSGNFATGNNGVSYTNESKVGTGAFEFDGIDDYVLLPNSFDSALTNDFTMNAWVKINSEATSDTFQVITDFRGERNLIISYVEATNTLEARFIGGTDITLKSDPISLGQWYFLTIQKNGSTGNLYLDSSLNDSNSVSNPSASATSTRIGLNPSGNGALDGYIDEWSFYNRTLSQAEIAELYNSGNGFNPYTTSATGITFNSPTNNQWLNDTNFTLDVSFSQTINSNYSLNGGTNTTLGTNVNNATVNLSGIPNIFNNISVYTSDNQSNSITFGIDTIGPNISIIGNLTQNNFEVDFSTIFAINDNFSGVASCTLNATYLENVTNASQYDQFLNCTDTTTFGASGLYNGFIEAYDNAGNLATLSVNGTIQPFVYVNFKNETNGDIGSYSYTLTSPNGIVTSETNTTNPISISPFTEGQLDLGNWTILFEKLGYNSQTFLVPINVSSGGIEYNFTINFSRIIINIYDRETNNLLNQNVDVSILNLNSGNTSNGTIIFQDINIPSGTYNIEAVSSGYATEQKTFTYTSQKDSEIDIYMLSTNLSNTATLTIATTDEFSNVLQGVDVRLLEYDSSIFGYREISQCVSNSNGECNFLILTDEKRYIVTGSINLNSILYTGSSSEDGEVFSFDVSGGQEIIGTTFIRELSLKISDTLRSPDYVGFLLDVPKNERETIVNENDTHKIINIPVSFTSQSGFNYEVCLNIYVTNQNNISKLITPICYTGSSGILPISDITLNKDYSYKAIVSVERIGSNNVIEYKEYLYLSNKSFSELLFNEGYLSNFLLFFWAMVLAFSIASKNLSIWIYGSFVLAVFQTGFMPNITNATATVLIILINLGVMYISKR